jgi:hypothetical protein
LIALGVNGLFSLMLWVSELRRQSAANRLAGEHPHSLGG